MVRPLKWIEVRCAAVALFLFGCFPAPEFDGDVAGADGGERGRTEVTVVTFNVENFDLGGEAGGQYDAVAAFAKGASADILVLEEVQSEGEGADEAAFTAALEAVSYPMPHVALSSMSDGFNAIGVWSRYPIDNFEEILPSNTRTAVLLTVDIDGTKIAVLGCHLKAGTDSDDRETRRDEAVRIAATAAEMVNASDAPFVLLGDLNTATEADFNPSGTVALLSLSFNGENTLYPVNLRELPDVPTHPETGALLDHIFLSTAARTAYIAGSVAVSRPAGDGSFGPSDHYPVQVTLGF